MRIEFMVYGTFYELTKVLPENSPDQGSRRVYQAHRYEGLILTKERGDRRRGQLSDWYGQSDLKDIIMQEHMISFTKVYALEGRYKEIHYRFTVHQKRKRDTWFGTYEDADSGPEVAELVLVPFNGKIDSSLTRMYFIREQLVLPRIQALTVAELEAIQTSTGGKNLENAPWSDEQE